MNHKDYKNITALYTALNKFLTDHYAKLNTENTSLTSEENQVKYEQNLLDTTSCPCVWDSWSDWGPCSQTCGNGTQTKTRNVLRHARNNGTLCVGSNTTTTTCSNPTPCRKNTLVIFSVSAQTKCTCSLQPLTVLGECGKNGLPALQIVGMVSTPDRGSILHLHSMVGWTALEMQQKPGHVMYWMPWGQLLVTNAIKLSNWRSNWIKVS